MLCEQPTELRNCHQLGFVPNSHQSRTSLSDFRKLNDESLPICLRTKGMLKPLDLPVHGVQTPKARRVHRFRRSQQIETVARTVRVT